MPTYILETPVVLDESFIDREDLNRNDLEAHFGIIGYAQAFVEALYEDPNQLVLAPYFYDGSGDPVTSSNVETSIVLTGRRDSSPVKSVVESTVFENISNVTNVAESLGNYHSSWNTQLSKTLQDDFSTTFHTPSHWFKTAALASYFQYTTTSFAYSHFGHKEMFGSNSISSSQSLNENQILEYIRHVFSGHENTSDSTLNMTDSQNQFNDIRLLLLNGIRDQWYQLNPNATDGTSMLTDSDKIIFIFKKRIQHDFNLQPQVTSFDPDAFTLKTAIMVEIVIPLKTSELTFIGEIESNGQVNYIYATPENTHHSKYKEYSLRTTGTWGFGQSGGSYEESQATASAYTDLYLEMTGSISNVRLSFWDYDGEVSYFSVDDLMNNVGLSTSTTDLSATWLISSSVTIDTTEEYRDTIHPVADSKTVNVQEDSITLIELSGSDADGYINAYQITNNPSNGSIYHDGNATTVIAQDTEFTSHTIYYKNTQDITDNTSFTFKVKDDSGNWSFEDATINITINAVNDPPQIDSVNRVFVEEDASFATITLDSTIVDPDDSTHAYYVSTLPTLGTLFTGVDSFKITKIHGQIGWWIDGFTFTYSDNTSISYGNSSNNTGTRELSSDEYIHKIEFYSNDSHDHYGKRLTFFIKNYSTGLESDAFSISASINKPTSPLSAKTHVLLGTFEVQNPDELFIYDVSIDENNKLNGIKTIKSSDLTTLVSGTEFTNSVLYYIPNEHTDGDDQFTYYANNDSSHLVTVDITINDVYDN